MPPAHRPVGPGGPAASSASVQSAPQVQHARKRKGHRGGKKKKPRRKSFAVAPDEMAEDTLQSEGLGDGRENFYSAPGNSFSNTSLDSEALLDHREQQPFLRPRRPSMAHQGASYQQYQPSQTPSRFREVRQAEDSEEEEDQLSRLEEHAPLLSSSARFVSEPILSSSGYGSNDMQSKSSPRSHHDSSLKSSSTRLANQMKQFTPGTGSSYNVNNPPSVPGTPTLGPARDMGLDDVMLRNNLDLDRRPSPVSSASDTDVERATSRETYKQPPLDRRQSIVLQAEKDVCFPQGSISELGEVYRGRESPAYRIRSRRRRDKWPDLSILEEWSRMEKEARGEEGRVKKITEPQLVNGRLRPVHNGWARAEEVSPYRFTYFNDQFQSTLHSQTLSELVQLGGSFKDLFIPEPPILSDTSDDEDEDEEDEEGLAAALHRTSVVQNNAESRTSTRHPSLAETIASRSNSRARRTPSTAHEADTQRGSKLAPADQAPADQKWSPGIRSPEPTPRSKPPKYGDRPVWWLDVLSPTEEEMKVISRAFGIHPLTSEDIMVQEPREKVELFRNYYFVNYRTFEQDPQSEDFLEPINMYVVVFREGVLSFHFSMTPHPANVRRRIRQLRDYLILSSDWISYAIIDDITDVFVPLIQSIEEEVDQIDDAILELTSIQPPGPVPKDKTRGSSSEHNSAWKMMSGKERLEADKASGDKGGDMLRQVGDCRKKVMSLYRLLGNKADVIKGFAKRCNANVEVAPRSEIGLYLGDIQDHIVTMTANLGHYEKILARCHANYIAQINIRMNERQEQTADVLGKLTVLGTIVLPMNIITGLWGMNVWVPGQEYEGDLRWFITITAGLLLFGVACYLIAKRVYKIV
ncbi:hypothetical protein VTK73DRAFT_6631 [Phialemonium thermophilum]|uniref:Uncharacterized protein n=1 Tax=Phialemonium thermophilum TaxID=223376 RepID=A0ABR3XWB5_9PEZI